METGLLAVLLGLPVLFVLFSVGYAYLDAPEYGMDPVKWAAISLVVPFFGFFAYLFERDERTPGPDRDMFSDGVFEIHESRADDTRLAAGTKTEQPPFEDENGQDADSERETTPASEWARSTETSNEPIDTDWNRGTESGRNENGASVRDENGDSDTDDPDR